MNFEAVMAMALAFPGTLPAGSNEWNVARKPARPKTAASTLPFDLICRGSMIVRSNDNRVNNTTPLNFSLRIDYTRKTANMYGLVPTIGGEYIFAEFSPITHSGGIISFPSRPQGMNKVVTNLQIERNSGSFHYLNRHQWAAVFQAIPLNETIEMSGTCSVDTRKGPRIPG